MKLPEINELNKDEIFTGIYEKRKNDIKNYITQKIWYQSNCRLFDAEELTNDVFLKVYKHLENFDPEKSAFTTWLITITNRVIIDWTRTKMLKQQHSIDSLELKSDGEIIVNLEIPDNNIQNDFNSFDNEIINKEFNRSIEKLRGISKDIAKLYFKKEYNYNEIEKELTIPMGTVKGTIHRLKDHIKKDLSKIY